MNKNRVLIVVLVILSISYSMAAYAAESLKNGLESKILYRSVSIFKLNKELARDKKTFKSEYDDKFVVVSGEIKEVNSDGKQIVIFDTGTQERAKVSSEKDVIDKAKKLVPGNKIVVYGQLSVTGRSNDAYEIKAKELAEVTTVSDFSVGSYAYADGHVYDGQKVSDLAPEDRVHYNEPETWQNNYVKSSLTNNDVVMPKRNLD